MFRSAHHERRVPRPIRVILDESQCSTLFWLSPRFRRIPGASVGFAWQHDQRCTSLGRLGFRLTTASCVERGSIIGMRCRCNYGIRSTSYSGRIPTELVIFLLLPKPNLLIIA